MEISEQLWILMGLAFTVAVVHSLSPDHWLPFVLLGRAKNWKIMHTLGIAGAAGTAHVGSSIIIGLIGVGLGEVLIEEFASTIDIVSGSALILFGVGFAYLSWRAKGHHRHGIPFLTRRLGVDMEETEKYMHVHGDEQEHSHDQGDEHGHESEFSLELVSAHAHSEEDPHAHGHEDSPKKEEHPHPHEPKKQDSKASGSKAGWGLVAIIGITPCVALLPIAFASLPLGMSGVFSVMAVFAVATLGTILLISGLTLRGLHLIKLDFVEKYGDVFAGTAIAAMGVLILTLGI